jgi:hypothetical protein
MKVRVRLFVILILMLLQCGCVVVQVARGKPGVNAEHLHSGIKRVDVESLLGNPVKQWVANKNIKYCVYEYNGGRVPSIANAFAFAFMDLATGGIIEVVGLVHYLAGKDLFAGDSIYYISRRILISYDDNDNVLGIFEEFANLPPDGRSGIYKWPHYDD